MPDDLGVEVATYLNGLAEAVRARRIAARSLPE